MHASSTPTNILKADVFCLVFPYLIVLKFAISGDNIIDWADSLTYNI